MNDLYGDNKLHKFSRLWSTEAVELFTGAY